MKDFDPHLVTISQEEHKQLVECKSIVELLWSKFGPYKWPKELRNLKETHITAPYPRCFVTRMYALFKFDDSE